MSAPPKAQRPEPSTCRRFVAATVGFLLVCSALRQGATKTEKTSRLGRPREVQGGESEGEMARRR